MLMREELHHLIDVLPDKDLAMATRVLKGIIVVPDESEIAFTPEEAEEFADFRAANLRAWTALGEDLREEV